MKMKKRRTLTIKVKNERGNPGEMDAFGNVRNQDPLGNNPNRHTTDGRKISYEYFHDTSGKLPDSARAVLYGRDGSVQAVAYIDGTYSEDFSLQTNLNRMLGVRLRK